MEQHHYMTFRPVSDLERRGPSSYEELIADVAGGNTAVVRWTHAPDDSDFDDDAAAFETIRRALRSGEDNDPRRLRKVAVDLAALLPSAHGRPSDAVLGSLWALFVSLARQTPSGNIAMLDLVVILDHLASSPRTTATVTVDGLEQLSRLHGLDKCIRESMASPYQSPDRMDTLARWINLNAFAALLWSYNLVDGRDFAVRQLRAAFEDRRSSDAADRDAADARLMAAAQWAIHPCQRLYHLSVTSDAAVASSGKGPAAAAEERWKAGPRFRGRAGFSFRRWEFWQQAFDEAREFGGGSIEAKVEAGAAAGMMEQVLYAGFEV
ncbi:Putative oxopyrrolidine biosynthesis cluster protein G [Colletotrichum destructivum]|uniref:Oxopyrrolidine biosynthesis cluster protein G n=1 Tax=Colletotrichum destructivum TaxID=34406 RepID=A0AAX4IMQ6_9PEZI|nr:Putative oxopyrrolidine biosynthesis cluster protein G [Colletotrichum destructivum]